MFNPSVIDITDNNENNVPDRENSPSRNEIVMSVIIIQVCITIDLVV